jgi:hypothetical protein
MSDKHTDAQRNEVIDRAIRFIESGSHTTIARDTMTNELRKICATEGQAQTSAAVDISDALSSLRWMYRRLPMAFGLAPSIEKTIAALAAVTGDNVNEDFSERAAKFECFSESASRAAQLADSTAPGAPVVAALEAAKQFLGDMHSMPIDWTIRESQVLYGKVCDALAGTATADVKAKELAEALTIKYSPILITWDALIWAVKSLVKTLSDRSAAPTAQQSLTAGGAVPDDLEIRKQVQEALGLGRDAHASFTWSYLLGAIKAAAAPLPQVQSEALDAWHQAVIDQCAAIECGYVESDPRQTLQNILNWHGELAVENMVHVSGLIQVRDQLTNLIAGRPDHQPVTPSRALADNDGGVK